MLHILFDMLCVHTHIMIFSVQSSVKKKTKSSTDLKVGDPSESCRKSLAADVEFQQSKVNALLEKIKSLGMFLM